MCVREGGGHRGERMGKQMWLCKMLTVEEFGQRVYGNFWYCSHNVFVSLIVCPKKV